MTVKVEEEMLEEGAENAPLGPAFASGLLVEKRLSLGFGVPEEGNPGVAAVVGKRGVFEARLGALVSPIVRPLNEGNRGLAAGAFEGSEAVDGVEKRNVGPRGLEGSGAVDGGAKRNEGGLVSGFVALSLGGFINGANVVVPPCDVVWGVLNRDACFAASAAGFSKPNVVVPPCDVVRGVLNPDADSAGFLRANVVVPPWAEDANWVAPLCPSLENNDGPQCVGNSSFFASGFEV